MGKEDLSHRALPVEREALDTLGLWYTQSGFQLDACGMKLKKTTFSVWMKYIFGAISGRTRRSESGPDPIIVLSPLAIHKWHLAAYLAMFLSRLIAPGKLTEAPCKVLFPLPLSFLWPSNSSCGFHAWQFIQLVR